MKPQTTHTEPVEADVIDDLPLQVLRPLARKMLSEIEELTAVLEYMADLFKDLAGDQSTESGWKTEEMYEVWERARAAIAKAEGRS